MANIDGMDGGGQELSPKEQLEQLRRKRQSVGWAEQLASAFAPKSSTDDFKLNWVGNIDRHQRELFWKLIILLCDQIDPYLTWMRLAHDIIQGAKARCLDFVHFISHTALPALYAGALGCAHQAFILARELATVVRLVLLRWGAALAKGALLMVGVGVALPPPRAEHAAAYSVGANGHTWLRRNISARVRLLGFLAASTSPGASSADKIVRPRSSPQRDVVKSADRFQQPETDSVLFPASVPTIYAKSDDKEAEGKSVTDLGLGVAMGTGAEVRSEKRVESNSADAQESTRVGRVIGQGVSGVKRAFGNVVDVVRSVDVVV